MRYAFRDTFDGYYEIELSKGIEFPNWTVNLTPCEVQQRSEPSQLPIVVSPWQMCKALNFAGLRQLVETTITESDDQNLKDGWNKATEFVENDSFVISLCTQLGKSDEERHNLFVLAKSL